MVEILKIKRAEFDLIIVYYFLLNSIIKIIAKQTCRYKKNYIIGLLTIIPYGHRVFYLSFEIF